MSVLALDAGTTGVVASVLGLLTGGLLTLGGALSDVSPLFGLAAAAHVVALAGWAVWFARWE